MSSFLFLLSGFSALLVGLHFQISWQTPAALILTGALLLLSLIDFDHGILPDSLTLPILWLGLLCNTHYLFVDPASAVLGAAGGYMTLWTFYWVFKLFTHQEGMGYGDFKLLAMLGAWMGLYALPWILCLASLSALLLWLVLRFSHRIKRTSIPFGPFLAFAGWCYLLWGEHITALFPFSGPT